MADYVDQSVVVREKLQKLRRSLANRLVQFQVVGSVAHCPQFQDDLFVLRPQFGDDSLQVDSDDFVKFDVRVHPLSADIEDI